VPETGGPELGADAADRRDRDTVVGAGPSAAEGGVDEGIVERNREPRDA
jgi:hypothetical protein